MIRLALADPQPLVLDGLELLCTREGDMVPVARCCDGEEVLRAVRSHLPDILIFDLPLKTLDGLSVIREMKKANLPTRTILLTTTIGDEQALEAMRLGVQGITLKTLPTHLIAQCIRKVHKGELWLEKHSAECAMRKLLLHETGAGRNASILTPREVEIVRMVGEGLCNAEIAARLRLKAGTVKVHLHSIYKKLAIGSRCELARCNRDWGK